MVSVVDICKIWVTNALLLLSLFICEHEDVLFCNLFTCALFTPPLVP